MSAISQAKDESSDSEEKWRPEALPSLLLDVVPNPHDLERDTLLPYFLHLKERHDKKREAEKLEKKQREDEEAARADADADAKPK